MEKQLKDSIAEKLYRDKISDLAFEGLKQHNYFNRGFKQDFAQEMIVEFYDLDDSKLDMIWGNNGYEGIKAFYFRMCLYQLLARSNKMVTKWLGFKNMFVDVPDKENLYDRGGDSIDTKVLDMEDYYEQIYNIDTENNDNQENTDIDGL